MGDHCIMIPIGNVPFHVESSAYCFKVLHDNQLCQCCCYVQHLRDLLCLRLQDGCGE